MANVVHLRYRYKLELSGGNDLNTYAYVLIAHREFLKMKHRVFRGIVLAILTDCPRRVLP